MIPLLVLALIVASGLALGRVADGVLEQIRFAGQASEILDPGSGTTLSEDLTRLVPVPQWVSVQGVSDFSTGNELVAVVGLEAAGRPAEISGRYRAELESRGWVLSGEEDLLNGLVFYHARVDTIALVMFSEVISGTTSIVIQVQ